MRIGHDENNPSLDRLLNSRRSLRNSRLQDRMKDMDWNKDMNWNEAIQLMVSNDQSKTLLHTKNKVMDSAPKDGTKIEISIEGKLPMEAYWGGGKDKGWREWHSCRLIMEPILGWSDTV